MRHSTSGITFSTLYNTSTLNEIVFLFTIFITVSGGFIGQLGRVAEYAKRTFLISIGLHCYSNLGYCSSLLLRLT